MKTYNRRQLVKRLSAAGISLTVFDQILNGVLSGAIESARADSIVLNSMNYVGLNLNSGPARWLFDLPLRETEGEISDLVYNPMVATGWSANTTSSNGTGRLTSEYRLINVGGANLPPIWEDYASLANHGLFMRNVETSPIHPDVKKQYAVDVSAPSTHAIASVIDSSMGIPAIVSSSGVPFYHPNNLAAVQTDGLSGDAAFNLVTKPFYNEKFLSKFNDGDDENGQYMLARIEETLGVLKGLSSKYNSSVEKFSDEYKKAEHLLLSNELKSITQEFSDLYNEYESLIQSSLLMPIKGVDSNSSGVPWSVFNTSYPDERAPNGFFVRDGGSVEPDNFFFEANTGSGGDYASAYNGATNSNMSTSFALADFFIRNSSETLPLTNSLLLNVGQLSSFPNDTHDMGAVGHIVGFSKYYKTFLECMNKFVTSIDSKFDDTLIHVASEFNRSPLYNARGSDHGFNGSGCSLYSGRIENPILIGDIKNDEMEQYQGEWGVCENSWNTKDIHNVITKILSSGQSTLYFTEEEELIQVDSNTGKVTSELNIWSSSSGGFNLSDLSYLKDKLFKR